MAVPDPIEDLPDPDEDYHESSDEDFNPTTAPADDSSSSDQEDAPAKQTKRKGKRKVPTDDELDSGDEVTIDALRKRRAKKRRGEDVDDELLLSDDDAGAGGLIKTRAQRRVEQKERKPLARTDGATVDVDALWAQMSADPLKPPHHIELQLPDTSKSEDAGTSAAAVAVIEDEEQVTVRRVYTFAGQRTTEESQIPRSSLERYLSEGWKVADAAVEEATTEDKAADTKDVSPQIRRPLRRPSRFDPNPTGFVRALPPEYQLTWPRKPASATAVILEKGSVPEAVKPARPEKAQKLNVVDKSRLDWTGFVHKEGIAEELDTHGKTKEAYLGRMEFLAGVEARREEERKRMKTVTIS